MQLRRNCGRWFLASLLASFASSAVAETPSDLSGQYDWRPIPMGGGGYFQVILPHPTRPGELYVTSDMTGVFIRRTPGEPFDNSAHSNPQMSRGADGDAVTGLAMHPDAPDTLFADVIGPGLMRSTDAGRTFQAVHEVQSFTKSMTPTLAIDPANASVIFRGTQKDGLYRSLQNGDPGTWQKLTVTQDAPPGEHFVVIPSNSPVRDGRTQTVYVGVRSHGVFVSRDGGQHFERVSAGATPPASTGAPAASQTVQLLREPLDGAAGQMPRNWNPEQSHMRDGVVLRQDGTLRYLEPVKKAAMLVRAIELPANVVQVTLSCDVRTVDLVKGDKAHETLIGAIEFMLADGSRQRPDWRSNVFVDKDYPEWTTLSATAEVPGNAKSVLIKFGSQAKSGGGHFANIIVEGKTGTPRVVDQNPAQIRHLRVDSQGALYVAHEGGLLRFSTAEGWVNVTPPAASGKSIRGVDVHPSNPDWLVAIESYVLHRSRDRGATWETLPTRGTDARIERGAHAPWFHFPVNAGGCNIAFDPHSQGRVWIADAYMLWETPDVWSDKPVFEAQWRGLENTVATQLAVAPRPDGAETELLATFADVRGLRFTTDLSSPETMFAMDIQSQRGTGGNDMAGIATSEQHPQRWYGSVNRGWKGPTSLMRSDDGGMRWRWVTNPYKPETNQGGPKLAVSATDPDRVVYFPGMKLAPRLSTDGGATWQDVRGLPWVHSGERNFNFDSNVAADTVDGSAFYAFSHHPQEGGLYISRDGGVSWQRAGADLPRRRAGDNLFPVQLVAKPGAAGHLAISIGDQGVFLSDDFGQSFRRLEPFTGGECAGVTYGAPPPGSQAPALYVQNYWQGSGRRSVFRSLDGGATWARIDNDNFYVDQPTLFTASRQIFGRVYQADLGQGLMVGQPLTAPTQPK